MSCQDTSQETSQDENNLLLSKKSLAVALSAPRAPPYGSLHRKVLLGGNSPLLKDADWSHHYRITNDRHARDSAHSAISHDTLLQRLKQRLTTWHYDTPRGVHPHLPAGPEWGDRMTRQLGLLLPLRWQNSFRDSGGFRALCDFLVTATAPMVPLAAPSSAIRFVQNSRTFQRIRYGEHARQFIHLYLPPFRSKANQEPSSPPSRIIFFIHGGAWGSGLPWMYRLVANPTFLVENNWAVAVVGYRTYPDGCVAEQVDDCNQAAARLQKEFPGIPTTLMGHSSGAHIALLMLVDRAIAQMEERCETDVKNKTRRHDSLPQKRVIVPPLQTVDSYVGLSGPYDISHHFDYEAARGVEEISPMKPVNGSTRENFSVHSPAQRLQRALARVPSSATHVLDDEFPPLCLIHGMDDETVPFTATGEAARVLRSCGVTRCQQVYLAETGHQDTVMHLMMGGSALDASLQFIQSVSQRPKEQQLAPASPQLVARSKL